MRNDKVVGTALYVELRKEGYTSQFLLTPEVVVDGKVVPFTTRSRVVSAEHPRKPWTGRPSPTVSSLEQVEAGETELEEAAKAAVTRLQPYLGYFENLAANGDWELYMEPLAVQMTAEDARQVASAGTPEALIRRIQSARVEANYGEPLWDETKTTKKKGA